MATPEKALQSPFEHAKRLVRHGTALLAGSAALAGANTPPVEAHPAATPEAHLARLKSVRELSGYNLHVTREQRAKLLASTVVIIRLFKQATPRPPDQNYWTPVCTATKIGSHAILTAKHCFPAANQSTARKPLNYVNAEAFDYAVARPVTKLNELYKPLQRVDGISAGPGLDAALLHVTAPPANWGVNTAQAKARFHAIPVRPAQLLPSPLKPGQQVALEGVTNANNDLPVMGTGRYLGVFNYNYSDPYTHKYVSRKVDLVGLQAANPQSDPANFGSSGASATFAQGEAAGPETLRFTSGYGRNHAYQLGENDPGLMQNEKQWYTEVQDQLGVRAGGFNVLVGFTRFHDPAHDMQKLSAGLRDYAPAASPLL